LLLIGGRGLPVICRRINTYFYIDTGLGASEIRTGSDFRKISILVFFEY